MPKHLYSEKLVQYQYYGYIVAVALMCTGMVFKLEIIIQIAALLWIAIALLYGYNVFRIIFHKTTLDYGNTTQ